LRKPGQNFVRIFVAFPLPALISDRIREFIAFYENCEGVRWTRISNLHITVFFIGEVRPEDLMPVKECIGPLLRHIEPIELSFEKVTFRGGKKTPSMVWVQFARNERFSSLSGKIGEMVSGFMTTNSSHPDPIPHITLARIKRKADISSVLTEKLSIPEIILLDRIELWQSLQTAEGVFYRRVE